jgi:hypothetical protein
MAAVSMLKKKPARSRAPSNGTATPATEAAAKASGNAGRAPRPRAMVAAIAQAMSPRKHQTAKKKRTKARRASVVTLRGYKERGG